MCRPLSSGGRRCNKHNNYGKQKTLLQAQKQYTVKRLTVSSLTPKQRTKLEAKLVATQSSLNALTEAKRDLGSGLHPFTMQLSNNTEQVLDALYDAGLHPYVVGGSVRDALLGLEQKDIDIEVYGGSADEIIKILKKLGKVDEVGKSFGVIKLMLGQEDYDISLPRKERKTGDGHRAFDIEPDPFMSLEAATARRDYTINALMYDHKLGYIVDKHGGYQDLQNKVLRHVSDAFDEDPLRVLRGVQMASRFGFTLHLDTIEKARSLQNEFNTLAIERVQIEFQKLYEKGKSTQNALQALKDTEWDRHFPGLKEANNELLWDAVARSQQLLVTKAIPQEKKPIYLGAVIASHLPSNQQSKFLSLTMVGDTYKNVAQQLIQTPTPSKIDDYTLRKMAYDFPRLITFRDWVFLQESLGNTELASRVEQEATRLGLFDTIEKDWVTGDDMLAMFPDQKPGRWLGQLLTKAREAQYHREFNTKTEALEWAKMNAEF